MKRIVAMVFGLMLGFSSVTALAGTGRVLLQCARFGIGQSEQPLGWGSKPGKPGVHDEYIAVQTPLTVQRPGSALSIRSTSDGEYKGATVKDGVVEATWITTAGVATPGAKVYVIRALMSTNMMTAQTSGVVQFIVDGVKFQDQCLSTPYTGRLLLR